METTEKDFEYFKERCLYWADRLGLDEWDLYFEHARLGEGVDGPMARSVISVQSCSATIHLGAEWDEPEVTEELLDDSAEHEIIHLLIANVVYFGYTAFKSEDALRKSEEALVMKLSKLLK